jgi:predicted metal-dependent hydrolase
MNQAAIRARRPHLPLDETIPRHWFGGSPLATHLANGINLLFPHGERFFVRSVKHYVDRVGSDRERADVRGFFAQESRHAMEHERFFEILEAQGYEIREFLRWYERWSLRIEGLFSPEVHLATTAACEHFTATLAHAALAEGLLDSAHPSVKALLFWHAAEEIEHKAVAYDVLQKVAPGYGVRLAGFVIASACLGGFWLVATQRLLAQDGVGLGELRRELRLLGRQPAVRRAFIRSMRQYLARDFHPWMHDNRALAERHLASLGASA